MNILFTLLTVSVLLGIGYLLSENRKAIKWKTILCGIAAQVVLMFIVLKTSVGKWALSSVATGITTVLSLGMEGVQFVFGDGLIGTGAFAITVLSVLCFTSAIISVLHYLKVIPFLVKHVGKFIGKIMGTTEVESFTAIANSFLGATESPLLTKPYLKDLTKSETFAVILGGFASVSVSVILGYSQMGMNMEFILVQMATVPFATLLISKLLVPETEVSKTKGVQIEKSQHGSIFDAIGSGAIEGGNVAINVGMVLIGFIGMIALVNLILGWFGTSLTDIFNIILMPLAWMLNIPSHEVATFTNAIGLKLTVNEFVAISTLSPVVADLSLRTQAILCLAVVNFANFSVIGITMGGFSIFCPSKKEMVSGLCLKALIGATLTSLISAALIGMFF